MNYMIEKKKYHFNIYYLDAIMLSVRNRHHHFNITEFKEEILQSIIKEDKYPEDYRFMKGVLQQEFKIHLPGT